MRNPSNPLKLKSNIFIFLLMIFFITGTVFSQSAGDYRTVAAGGDLDWNNAANWDRYNGTIWVNNVDYPGETSSTGVVTIQNAGTPAAVTLNVALSNPIIGLYIADGSSLDLNGFDFENEDTTVVDGTLILGTGSHTFVDSVAINGSATFYANSSSNTLSGNLTISSGANWVDEATNTATFSFPENIAYTVSIDGGRSFDKIEHTTTSAIESARTLTFTGGTATIRTSYTRSGRSLGTNGTINYSPGATLIYAPAGAVMTRQKGYS